MKKISFLSAAAIILLTASLSFAQETPAAEQTISIQAKNEPASAPATADNMQKELPAAAEKTTEINVNPRVIEKTLPAYTLSLKELIKKAQENIRKTEGEIRLKKILEANREKEDKARSLFAEAGRLHEQGKLEEAMRAWKECLLLTKDPEMRSHIEKFERQNRAEQEEKRKQSAIEARKAKEQKREKRLEEWQEQQAKEAFERERRKKERLARKQKQPRITKEMEKKRAYDERLKQQEGALRDLESAGHHR